MKKRNISTKYPRYRDPFKPVREKYIKRLDIYPERMDRTDKLDKLIQDSYSITEEQLRQLSFSTFAKTIRFAEKRNNIKLIPIKGGWNIKR